MRIYVGAFVTLLLLWACSSEIEIKTGYAQPKLVVYCFPGEGDTLFISLSQTVPLNKLPESQPSVDSSLVCCSVNGHQEKAFYKGKQETQIPSLLFYVVYPAKEGDVVEVNVSNPDFEPAKAVTVIPNPCPVLGMGILSGVGYGNSYRQIQVRLSDEVATDDYYAVKLLRQDIYKNDTASRFEVIDVDKEPILNWVTDVDRIFGYTNDFFNGLYVFHDKDVQGKMFTLRLNVPRSGLPEMEENERYVIRYRVLLYHLSEEYYRFYKSVNDKRNNDMGGYGLSFINMSYTNVMGGFGVVGAYRVVGSDWCEVTE